ncbi:hypothetical protein [Pectobacterium odoriferum]|uniref:hypothetical protein n=1 Tax=Pectobacterium odoriferum TaxID=78398 RepID=UPI000A9567BA|nr:hypothetical protein [Pectobacterium odoriferum]
MSLLTYTLLAKNHNKKDFNCGVPELNTYLQKYAGQDSRERFTKCYAAVDENNNVAGFYTLSSSAIDISGLPDTITKKLPRYPSVPAALLGRLAVDSQFAGKGIYPSYFKLLVRWLPLLTPVTYCCKLLGIRAVAAFTQLELFRV